MTLLQEETQVLLLEEALILLLEEALVLILEEALVLEALTVGASMSVQLKIRSDWKLEQRSEGMDAVNG